MSQPITALTKDNLICIQETIDGTTSDVLYGIICTPDNNPYGDYYFLVREYATGTGASESSFRYGSTSTSVNYEDSLLDQFMTGEFTQRLSDGVIACMPTVSITCYNAGEDASYTIARKIFALSNKELGGNYSNDESVSLGYFTNNASRITRDKNGNAVSVWTRSPSSTSAVCCVSLDGNLFTFSPSGYVRARPALNLLSSSLVASVANGDGSYNLITSDTSTKKAGFIASLGDTDTRPEQIKLSLSYKCTGTVSVKACNNYNDASPAWETVSLNSAHSFSNQSKTADRWAVGVKVEAEAENDIILYEPIAVVLCEEEETA